MTAKKSSTMTPASAHLSGKPFFSKKNSEGFFSEKSSAAPGIQFKMTVNEPGDRFEQEADKKANKIMRMSDNEIPKKSLQRKQTQGTDEKLQKPEEEKIRKADDEKLQKSDDDKLQKAEDERLQRRGGNRAFTAPDATPSTIRNKTTGGQPLGSEVRSFMEPRFKADFGNVRIHTDSESAKLNNQLSARAFTYQNHIFFSNNQYQPGTSEGKTLLAHELTHTIQQGHSVQLSPQTGTTPATPTVQRLGVQDALDYFAERAYLVPGFRMLTIVLGFNPINMRSTDRSAANILRALIELIPGGRFITQALDNHGVITRAADWIGQKLTELGDIGGQITVALSHFIDSLSWRDIFDLGGVWERAKSIFSIPITRLINFGISAAAEILKMIKDTILRPLAVLAEGTRGYDLLKALLGEDPITGEPVPRTAENLIGGFMKFIGQEEIWQNIQRGNAVARAWAWFQGVMTGLVAQMRAIPGRVIAAVQSLTIQDVLTVAGAFRKIVGTFAAIAGDFLSWGLDQVISLLEILFSVVAPGVMPYIAKARTALTTILHNPIGFVGNLVRAGKKGFELFWNNIGTHLKTALIGWLTGPLGEAGVYIPQSFSLMEIVKLVLSVLGLTWQNIRQKLVRIIPEPVLAALETTAGILVTLVRYGPAAAWEQIKNELSELKDQLIGEVTAMVTTEIVKAATLKLATMLNPAGAVIQAIISIYNTIMFFVEKITQIAQVVASFIDSISAIASGQIMNAARAVERTMARTLTLVISFMARFVGLGNVPNKLVGIVRRIRRPIDRGLDKIVAWLGRMLQGMMSRALGGDPNAPGPERVQNALGEAVPRVNRYAGRKVGMVILRPLLAPIKARHRLSRLEVVPDGTHWAVEAAASPAVRQQTTAEVEGSGIAGMTSRIRYTSGSVAGRTVGREMEADPLGPDHPAGQEPAGENIWRDILVTDPHADADKKYIRGHLLNHHVGGTGTAQNLFPITALANSNHESQIESRVKQWVNTERKWVYYKVQVTNIQPAVNPRGRVQSNKIDANFVCTASVIDPNQPAGPSNRHNTITATIVSRYRPPPGAATVENQSGPRTVRNIEARPEDLAATIQTPAGTEYTLNGALFSKMQSLGRINRDVITEKIQTVTGIGSSTTVTLFRAFTLSRQNNRGDISTSLSSGEKGNLTRLNNNASAILSALNTLR